MLKKWNETHRKMDPTFVDVTPKTKHRYWDKVKWSKYFSMVTSKGMYVGKKYAKEDCQEHHDMVDMNESYRLFPHSVSHRENVQFQMINGQNRIR